MSIARIMQQAAAGVAGGSATEGAWDLSYAYSDEPQAGDLSLASYSGFSVSVASEENLPQGIFFRDDGARMYVIGLTGDDVNQYNIGTDWRVSTATYLSSESVATEQNQPRDVFFSPDGTKMYIVGSSGDAVDQYSLGTAWAATSASHVQSFSISAQGETTPTGIFFKPSGTKMYIVGLDTDSVLQYDLSAAWDISTASYVQAFSVAAEDPTPEALSFVASGTIMLVIGNSSNEINSYTLSTAWDISTASYSQTFSVSSQATSPAGMYFRSDGLYFAVVGNTTDTVFQYSIPGGFSVAAQETNPEGIFFKPDGTKMYIVGTQGDDVTEYDLSTAWDVSTASYVQNFSIAAQETSVRDVFFKPDGTKMYITGTSGDDVNEYDLSTPWDVSSASYLQNFSVSGQDTAPEGLFFKPDGTKMYVAGDTGNDVNEYDLSTPWDVSSASYLQNFSVSGQDTAPTDVFFKPDGTKMYVSGVSNDAVNEYELSAAWDISTAVYTQSFGVLNQIVAINGISFKPDGTKMYAVGGGTVFTYSIGAQP